MKIYTSRQAYNTSWSKYSSMFITMIAAYVLFIMIILLDYKGNPIYNPSPVFIKFLAYLYGFVLVVTWPFLLRIFLRRKTVIIDNYAITIRGPFSSRRVEYHLINECMVSLKRKSIALNLKTAQKNMSFSIGEMPQVYEMIEELHKHVKVKYE